MPGVCGGPQGKETWYMECRDKMLFRVLGLVFLGGSLCIGKESKGIFVPGNLLKVCGKTPALLFAGVFALL